ncbi:MAG: sigma-54-dependent transcriptional regulator [Syntrophales bacterium]
MPKILVVDDECSIRETLTMFLSEKGHELSAASSGQEGIALFESFNPEVIILDIRLPDQNGLEVLSQMRSRNNLAKVIMITAFQDMDTTIQAMKRGAYDYIHKPLDADEIEKAVNGALHTLRLEREASLAREKWQPMNRDAIIGKSKEMRDIFKMIGLLCQNRASVLIEGETGTGKELIARMIHQNRDCAGEPFITLDCSAVVETLLESELFGHEKGAYTGAEYTKKGKIELAAGGTLFLDEVGELPLALQGKLLGFLQRHEYMRVGGQKILQSHCRIIAATNRNLAAFVQQGKFREDLYFRLNVVSINVPPLRERISDIPHLARHFLRKINMELGTDVCRLHPGVLKCLSLHPWKGNVRELENVLVEAVVKARGKVILAEDIEKILKKNSPLAPQNLSDYSLPVMEREQIQKALSHVSGKRTEAARLLGISLPTLRSKIRKYNLIVSSRASALLIK